MNESELRTCAGRKSTGSRKGSVIGRCFGILLLVVCPIVFVIHLMTIDIRDGSRNWWFIWLVTLGIVTGVRSILWPARHNGKLFAALAVLVVPGFALLLSGDGDSILFPFALIGSLVALAVGIVLYHAAEEYFSTMKKEAMMRIAAKAGIPADWDTEDCASERQPRGTGVLANVENLANRRTSKQTNDESAN